MMAALSTKAEEQLQLPRVEDTRREAEKDHTSIEGMSVDQLRIEIKFLRKIDPISESPDRFWILLKVFTD